MFRFPRSTSARKLLSIPTFSAITTLWEPYQIERVAKARAKAQEIQIVADIRTDLQRRSAIRFLAQEVRAQENIEAITLKALPQISEDAKPEDVNDDWIAGFFDKSKLISDEQMQSLWAHILAGEANAPGRFSKRTISVVANLDKTEAEMFTKFCSCTLKIRDRHVPFVYSSVQSISISDVARKMAIYNSGGITFETIAHLEAAGLIQSDNSQPLMLHGLPVEFYADYFGSPVHFQLPVGIHPQVVKSEDGTQRLVPDVCSLFVGNVLFTQAGQQLAPLAGAKPIPSFIEYIKSVLRTYSVMVNPEPVSADKKD